MPLRAKFKINFRTRISNQGNKAAPTNTNQGNKAATTSTNAAPTMRTIFKILLNEGEKNLKETRRIRTISEQIEKRILKNNNLIRRCKDMDQLQYMNILLTRQADKEIDALHNELANVNKCLDNMTNMILDPDNENFADHVEGSIQHYKQKKIDLEEGIKVQKNLKQGYQTVITTLTKQNSMSKTNTTSKPDIPNISRTDLINLVWNSKSKLTSLISFLWLTEENES